MFADQLQLPVVLQHLTGDVQRQIRGIHDAADEVEIVRQQLFAALHDQDAGAVQRQAGTELVGIVILRRLRGNIQQRVVTDLSVHGDGQDFLRHVLIVEVLGIEAVVLLGLHLRFAALPERHHGVERFEDPLFFELRIFRRAAFHLFRTRQQHLDGETDVIRILLHQFIHRVLPHVAAVFVLFLPVGTDVHNDVRALGPALRGFDREPVRPAGTPAVGFRFAVLSADDVDAVGHHERGIEPHAELADDVGFGRVFRRFGLQLFAETRAAGERDGAQVLFQFFGAHADAVVRHR